MQIEQLDEVLEALLFVAGNPINASEIIEKLELQKSELNASIKRLQEKYKKPAGINLMYFNGKLQFASNPDYGELVSMVLNPIKEKELSRSSMEVAAIIAYKQPITRLEVEQVRGVNSDYAIQLLLKQNLICVTGRKDVVGKPLLFSTTDEFLKRFGLSDLAELPDYDDLLDRIKVIQTVKAPEEVGLYNDFEIPDEEPTPEFLEGEKLERVSAESSEPIDEAAATKDESND